MNFKIAGLASTALLLLTPISGALSAVVKSPVVHATASWDYDAANSGLSEYDRLLQNAGPSDGQIDWYPAEHFASSQHIRPSLLVKQLIGLSIATNDANSKARNVLFNNTTGHSHNLADQGIYQKYNLAFGFIAQLLSFNNAKTGQGAYLKQGFESEAGNQFSDEDIIAETGQTPHPKILETPAVGEGINLADVLGRAFFGNAADAYAQLYVNGYDNTVQNASNIIRETTTSITIVAQSKLTGRKATAIFKLNNKTFNNLPPEVLLENNIDNSPSFAGGWGNQNIPDGEDKNLGDSTAGTFNQRSNLITGLTGDQRRLLSTGGSAAWVDPQTGSGTIVVPRGTSAAEIAKKIKQLGYKSNYNIANVAPMKAIHGDKYTAETGERTDLSRTRENSYNVAFADKLVSNRPTTPESKGNATALSNNKFDSNGKAENSYFAIADPRLNPDPNNDEFGYSSIPDLFSKKGLTTDFSNSLLFNPLNTNKSNVDGFNNTAGYNNKTANAIPNQEDNALGNATSWFNSPREITPQASSYKYGEDEINSNLANDQLGNVVHAFEPKENAPASYRNSPFRIREAWDDTHAIFGTAPFSGLTEAEIKNQIANNGSFNNPSGDQIKKSFTFNMPLNNSVMKSYRNPYSTVISTALPFSNQTKTNFKAGVHYSGIATNDMNNSTDNFSGKYLQTTSSSHFTTHASTNEPYTNPWYTNSASADFTNEVDQTGKKIDGKNGAKPLHLTVNTWVNERYYDYSSPTSQPGLYNVKNIAGNNEFGDWIDASADPLKGKDPVATHVKQNTSYPNFDKDSSDNSSYDDNDAHNDYDIKADWKTSNAVLPISPIYPYNATPINGRVYWNNLAPDRRTEHVTGTVPFFDRYTHQEQHLQLAKNVGYILINVKNVRETAITKQLTDYQIPGPLVSETNELNGIKNHANFVANTDLPNINPVDDDGSYRGGLLGVMSITGTKGKGTSFSDCAKQENAGSIFNHDSHYLQVPTNADDAGYKVKVDLDTNHNPVGAKYDETNLQYGLAWNDSSDLPQVKITRSLNAQYLVPVSVVRTATTTWVQDNRAEYIYEHTGTIYTDPDNGLIRYQMKPRWKTSAEVGGGANPGFKRTVSTTYDHYKLFLGNVTLEDQNTLTPTTGSYLIDTNSHNHLNKFNYINADQAKIQNLLPVNNQINYERTDKSLPHYDSELFDHGSNRKDVTVTRDGLINNFVGTSTELTGNTNEDNVGSSDDYAIGIVKAPKNLFNVGDDGVPTGGQLTALHELVESTENNAGDNAGINKWTDDPKNSNGMSIGKASSYATLAQAYNIEINGNKAVGKADDTAQNKSARVALVQQLLDHGGNSGAYYYIPSLPRLYEKWNEARINVVVYDQADTAVLAPTKAETKPSFSTTDRATGNDPFNPQFQPYTTTYDDGAVLKGADVPQSFQNLLQNTLVAGNPDLVNHPMRLEQVLVSAFLNSWQQNAKSVSQTANSSNSTSALYLAGGFGISNSDTKNSYSQWPNGYATNSGDYLTAISHFTGDFYRGGTDLQLVRGGTVKGIPASALKADVSKVDLSQAGTYPVVYTYTNPANAKDSASITVFVNVKASAAPVFAFQGGSDATLHVGESFDRNDYKVVGNWQIFNRAGGDYAKLTNGEGIATGSDGKPQVTITGTVDVQTPGVYQVTYEATNLAGVKAKMVRNITVLPNGASSDWTITTLKSVGYINYTPGYGINVWNAPAGTFTGQRLLHGTSWKIFQKAVNRQGQVYYNVGQNQWLDGQYLSFTPVSTLQPLNGVVTINYVPGYGVNLWKNASPSGGYYKRKLPHGSKWRVMGQQNGFYNVGKNQWIQAKFVQFQAH